MNSKKKRQLIWALVLLLLLVLAYGSLKLYEKNQPTEEEAEAADYTVTNIDASKVMEIGIIGVSGTVNLEKQDDTWICVEDETLSVDQDVVESYLNSACAITSDTEIAEAEDLAQYGLEEPALQVTLQWEDQLYTLNLGNYNSIISAYYLNVNDSNTVYTVTSSLYSTLNKTQEDFEAIVSEEEEEETEETTEEESTEESATEETEAEETTEETTAATEETTTE